MLTSGQRHDSKVVPQLLENLPAKALLADKAYDSDKIVQCAQEQGMQVIIPCKANRKQQRALDKHRYKVSVHLQSVTFELSFGTNPFNVSPNQSSASHFKRMMLPPRP